MRYERMFCAECKDYTVHYGVTLPDVCIRHQREQVVMDQGMLMLSSNVERIGRLSRGRV